MRWVLLLLRLREGRLLRLLHRRLGMRLLLHWYRVRRPHLLGHDLLRRRLPLCHLLLLHLSLHCLLALHLLLHGHLLLLLGMHHALLLVHLPRHRLVHFLWLLWLLLLLLLWGMRLGRHHGRNGFTRNVVVGLTSRCRHHHVGLLLVHHLLANMRRHGSRLLGLRVRRDGGN